MEQLWITSLAPHERRQFRRQYSLFALRANRLDSVSPSCRSRHHAASSQILVGVPGASRARRVGNRRAFVGSIGGLRLGFAALIAKGSKGVHRACQGWCRFGA